MNSLRSGSWPTKCRALFVTVGHEIKRPISRRQMILNQQSTSSPNTKHLARFPVGHGGFPGILKTSPRISYRFELRGCKCILFSPSQTRKLYAFIEIDPLIRFDNLYIICGKREQNGVTHRDSSRCTDVRQCSLHVNCM